MTRVAGIDCGTNSIRLLIAEIDGDNVTEITRQNRIVRLGQGVDASGRLDPAAIARTRKALEEYAKMMKLEEVTTVRMVATSATRDATNREDFFSMTEEVLGEVVPGARAEVITGRAEAELSFRGAITDLDPEMGPFCVIDLGGGSTEFIVGDADGTVRGSHSTMMGTVRLTERFLTSDPATEEEIKEAKEYIADRLDEVTDLVPLDQAKTFVGVAGSFTTLSALTQGLENYDPADIQGSVLRFDALRVQNQQIVESSAATLAANPVIMEGREDVIAAGSVIINEIMDLLAKHGADSFVISERDILDGIVVGLAS